MLGVGVSVDSRIFKEWLQGSKPITLRNSLYHWKYIETKMFEMGLHNSFGHVKHKLWSKERSGVKLAVWPPTTKSRESTRCPCVQVACNTSLEISWHGLQLCFRPHPDRRFAQEVIVPQSHGSSNFDDFGTPIWKSQDKNHLDEGIAERYKVYDMGEGGGFPGVRAMASLVSPKSLVARPSTKSARTLC
jgi:hypothetical protein